jgi:hypothetical protein
MQVQLLMEMLNTTPWKYYPLAIHFLSSKHSGERGGCSEPPQHMPVTVGSLEVRVCGLGWDGVGCGGGRLPCMCLFCCHTIITREVRYLL